MVMWVSYQIQNSYYHVYIMDIANLRWQDVHGTAVSVIEFSCN